MTRRVEDLLDQIGEFVLAYPGVEVSPFDDGGRGEVGYRSTSSAHPGKWVFRFRDLQQFYVSSDPRAEQIRTYMSTLAGRQQLPILLAEMLRPIEIELEFIGPLRTRFQVIDEW